MKSFGFKRVMVMVLALVLVFSLSVTAFAGMAYNHPTPVDASTTSNASRRTAIGSASNVGGAYVSDANYVDAQDELKYDITSAIAKTPNLRAAATWEALPGTIIRYEQEEDDYCVAAAMQTILRYTTGDTPPSQDDIADDMGYSSGDGIDFLEVPPYLNGNQDEKNYIMHNKDEESDMTYRIMRDMTVYEVPTPIRIEVDDSSDWFYETWGHAVVAYSIMSDESEVALIDPGAGWSWYDKDSDDLFRVFTHLAW